MKKILLRLAFIALLACLPASLLAQEIADTPENRNQQAERYFATSPPQALFQELAAKDAANLIPADQKKFQDAFMANVDLPGVKKVFIATLVKHFSAGELKALADFYGSAVGKSSMAKLNGYMAEIKPVISAEIKRAQEAANQSLISK
ncbi:MAG: DUF2059 domain-containing protein [Chthoniobacterales bacterium]